MAAPRPQSNGLRHPGTSLPAWLADWFRNAVSHWIWDAVIHPLDLHYEWMPYKARPIWWTAAKWGRHIFKTTLSWLEISWPGALCGVCPKVAPATAVVTTNTVIISRALRASKHSHDVPSCRLCLPVCPTMSSLSCERPIA